jgi:hypothetical protein
MINARSPYIYEFDFPNTNTSSIELRFAQQGGSFGTDPDYVLSKKVPATNLTKMRYNISPFIREVIKPLLDASEPLPFWSGYFAVAKRTPADNKKVKTSFFLDSSPIGDEIKNVCDGWGYFEQGENPDYKTGTGTSAGTICLDQGDYYYLVACNNPTTTPDTNPLYRFPYIDGEVGLNWSMKITNLVTNATVTDSLSLYDSLRTSFRHSVFGATGSAWYGAKFKIEFLNNADTVVWRANFYPVTEAKYTPFVCDFINKYGAWQRTWFFKASIQNFEVTNEEYKGLDGTYSTFNTNGKKPITLNTGWVNENYNETVLKQLMLSENIRINNERVKIKTKSTKLQKHINDNTINYTLEFDYSFDVLNTIAL